MENINLAKKDKIRISGLQLKHSSESNAMDKARMIADKVTWTSVSKNDSEA